MFSLSAKNEDIHKNCHNWRQLSPGPSWPAWLWCHVSLCSCVERDVKRIWPFICWNLGDKRWVTQENNLGSRYKDCWEDLWRECLCFFSFYKTKHRPRIEELQMYTGLQRCELELSSASEPKVPFSSVEDESSFVSAVGDLLCPIWADEMLFQQKIWGLAI